MFQYPVQKFPNLYGKVRFDSLFKTWEKFNEEFKNDPVRILQEYNQKENNTHY